MLATTCVDTLIRRCSPHGVQVAGKRQRLSAGEFRHLQRAAARYRARACLHDVMSLQASRAAVTGRSAATLAERTAGASGSANMALVRLET